MRQNAGMAEPRGPRPNRPKASRGDGAGGALAAEAANSTVRGIVLILAAIFVGVVLLNVIDPGSDSSTAIEPKNTTSTSDDSNGTTTTAEPNTDLLPHDQIRIQVLNGRGEPGVAGAMTEALKGQGYTSAADPRDAEPRTGDLVACKEGLEGEAAELATLVGDNVEVGAFPDPAPATAAADAQCLVILGSVATT